MKVFNKLALSICGFLAACGGGGGGGGNSCDAYCGFACAKASICGFFVPSQRLDCESACNASSDRSGRSDQSCEDAQREVESRTCEQLAIAIGLRREKSLEDLTAEELGISLGSSQEQQ